VIETDERGVGYSALEPGAAARTVIGDGRALRAAIAVALTAPEAKRQSARRAYESLRGEVARRELAKMPLDRIKEITQGRLRLGAIEQAGFTTVGQVVDVDPHRLDAIQGVGPDTAFKVIAAARQLQAAITAQTRVRIDPDARTASQAELLAQLHSYEGAKTLVPPQGQDLSPLAAELDLFLDPAARASSRLRMFFTGASRKLQARDALGRLAALLRSPATAAAAQRLNAVQRSGQPDATWLWNDYLARPVAYNGLLIEVAELAPGQEASQGFLPADIARRVREYQLDLSLMTASLRGYQAFGAKFALVQRRVMLGDEMGLGKTVQALAAMCHLAAGGTTHFLVVCPASVIVNWTREVQQHTKLQSYRLHGADREQNQRAWTARGGIAVTTYEALRTMPAPEGVALGMLTVDEAHYAKNPAALRTKAVMRWAARTERVLFMTGTPMENRVEEFRALVGQLRPDVAATVRAMDGALGSTRFRQAVAPVYLRRNQEDVLSELPPRLETQDWVALDGKALAAYRDAVYAGNFMAMRRAAFAPGTVTDSAKLSRLVDIVDEATADGRKVVVFSYFRDVLDLVAATLGQKTAASVVIITEPQVTPAKEEQAIARCHRMGQVRRVDVHRLLSEDSVDQRMLEILHRKRVAFDEYARRSDLKEIAPDAVDISDLAAAKAAATQAENERRIVEIEQKRLRAE
jgi:hypothetical protein